MRLPCLFDEETATNIQKNVNSAITESSKLNPDKGKISQFFDNATDIAKTVSKFVENVKPIVTSLLAGAALVAKLFN